MVAAPVSPLGAISVPPVGSSLTVIGMIKGPGADELPPIYFLWLRLAPHGPEDRYTYFYVEIHAVLVHPDGILIEDMDGEAGREAQSVEIFEL